MGMCERVMIGVHSITSFELEKVVEHAIHIEHYLNCVQGITLQLFGTTLDSGRVVSGRPLPGDNFLAVAYVNSYGLF